MGDLGGVVAAVIVVNIDVGVGEHRLETLDHRADHEAFVVAGQKNRDGQGGVFMREQARSFELSGAHIHVSGNPHEIEPISLGKLGETS
ncbi:MAG TPA: hypothetical protein VN034_12030 [Sphingopyxis sp.]|nr:hypothetical protein [Sphingopyxis sp.]